MYVPPAFQFSKAEALTFVEANDFGVLVTRDLTMSYIPMLLKKTANGLVLCGHISARNPQVEAIRAGKTAKVLFAGPHAYISPTMYTEPLRNVPTWNYQAVEILGTLKATAPENTLASMTAQVEKYETEWAIGDLSEKYVAGNLRGILAFELSVDEIIGKNKMSQNKPQGERSRVADQLGADGQDVIAALMRKLNHKVSNGDQT
ncbi:MAG: FMN-binding negative transcriptional regulator [Robiginitomaculum sp.]|nr:FMN-binding negative transcriptional regulator [Robiginitomaculum sp.]